MNELVICDACQSPADCDRCEGIAGEVTCEHICGWILEEGR